MLIGRGGFGPTLPRATRRNITAGSDGYISARWLKRSSGRGSGPNSRPTSFNHGRRRPSVGENSGGIVSPRYNPPNRIGGGVGRERDPEKSTTPTPIARRSSTALTRPTRRPSGDPGRP